MGDIRTLAQATDARDAALDLVARQRARVDRVRVALKGARRRRVVAIEWFDPVFIAGHWTPQLIEHGRRHRPARLRRRALRAAGRGRPSAAAKPEVVVCIPCGYDGPRALAEAEQFARPSCARWAPRRSSRSTPPPTSRRPGPRLVDGLETLAHALHPDRVPRRPAACTA